MKAFIRELAPSHVDGDQQVTHEMVLVENGGSPLRKESKRSLIQLVYGSVAYGEITELEASEIAEAINGSMDRDVHSTTLSGERRDNFIAITARDQIGRFVRKRKEQIVANAAITAYGVSDTHNELSLSEPDIKWYDEEGILSDNVGNGITPVIFRFEDVSEELQSMTRDGSEEVRIAEQNREHVNAFRFIINPAIPHEEYIQLVKVKDDGVVRPFATILSDHYFNENQVDEVEPNDNTPIAEN